MTKKFWGGLPPDAPKRLCAYAHSPGLKGNKDSAVRGFRVLEEAGLGTLIENKPQRGATLVGALHFAINFIQF